MTAPDPIPADALLAEADALLPNLDQVVADAQRLAEQLRTMLRRPYDPASDLGMTAFGMPRGEFVLALATADVKRALVVLDELALHLPARQDPRIATTGGPGQTHPWPPAGEGPTPGPAAALGAASESAGGVPSPGAGDGFSLPRPPDFEIGRGAQYDSLPAPQAAMRGAVARLRDGRMSTEGYPPPFPGSPPGPPPPSPKTT